LVYGAPNGLNAYSKEALAAVNTAFGLPVPDIELYTTSMFTGMNYSMCYLPGQSCGESDLDVQMITQVCDSGSINVMVLLFHLTNAFSCFSMVPVPALASFRVTT